jgi:NAD-dependent SIR2 family protein deacetylase
VRDSLIVEAHGSFASARCIVCHKEASQAWVKEQVEAGACDQLVVLPTSRQCIDAHPSRMTGTVPLCPAPGCKGRSRAYVKPDIVFFGESLPDKFFAHLGDLASCDLLLVFGTSLKVQVRALPADDSRGACNADLSATNALPAHCSRSRH